jgi:hypothetical protein
MFCEVKAMVLGGALGPNPGPQEATRGPKTANSQTLKHPGNQILRVSMGRLHHTHTHTLTDSHTHTLTHSHTHTHTHTRTHTHTYAHTHTHNDVVMVCQLCPIPNHRMTGYTKTGYMEEAQTRIS